MGNGAYTPIAVTPQQAVELTGLSRKIVTTALDTGCLKYVRVGKQGTKRIILVSDIHEFLSRCSLLNLRLDDDPVYMRTVAKTLNDNFK